MRVSIITACLNNQDTLEDTIKSVLAQSYPDIEYIVVDGNSTDGTREIIERHSARIAKVISETNSMGVYGALNEGIRLATGDVIGFLHADDLYAQDAVIRNVADIFSKKNVDAVYGDLVYVDKKNTRQIVRYWRAGEFCPGKLLRGWLPPHPTFFVKKSVYEKHGLFDVSFQIAADYDIILRFLLDQKINPAYIPEVLIKMRLGGVSNRSLRGLFQKSAEDFTVLKKHRVPFPWMALLVKNLSKLPQFLTFRCPRPS